MVIMRERSCDFCAQTAGELGRRSAASAGQALTNHKSLQHYCWIQPKEGGQVLWSECTNHGGTGLLTDGLHSIQNLLVSHLLNRECTRSDSPPPSSGPRFVG
jgi:hypothetical protein